MYVVELVYDDRWQPRHFSIIAEEDDGATTDILVAIRPSSITLRSAMAIWGGLARAELAMDAIGAPPRQMEGQEQLPL